MTASATDDHLTRELVSHILDAARLEKLVAYTGEELQRLAEDLSAWASRVAPGQRDVRVFAEASGFSAGSAPGVLETAGPDIPFLVDSLLNECAALGLEVKALFHPVLTQRDGRRLSIIQILLPPMTEGEAERLKSGAQTTLAHVEQAVADHAAMQARMRGEMQRLSAQRHLDPAERDEAVAFLDWLQRDHYVFLGSREYDFEQDKKGAGEAGRAADGRRVEPWHPAR